MGGRPWPLVCPQCRRCGGQAPKHFYRSRGLCNICYKKLRTSPKLDQYPSLPECCSDNSYRTLLRDPLRWLQRELGGAHAAQFRSPSEVKAEAQRVFDLAVRRWYGDETPPVTPFVEVPLEVRVWSDDMADPVVASPADTGGHQPADVVRTEKQRKKRRAHELWRCAGGKAHAAILDELGAAARPRVVRMALSTTLCWDVGKCMLTLTLMSSGVLYTTLEQGEIVLEETDFNLEDFRKLVRLTRTLQ